MDIEPVDDDDEPQPFVDMAGRMLVRRAIKNAKRKDDDGSSLPNRQ